jgi:hypothetical protein
VDGDGDLDLLTANYANARSVSIRSNNGAGVFSGGTEVAINDGPEQLVLGDIDGDGDLDMLVGGHTTSICRNNGAGAFTVTGVLQVGVRESPQTMALGDVDGDGDLDYVSCNGLIEIRMNDGLGNFSGTGEIHVTANGVYPAGIALGDVNNDGSLDILVANGGINCSQCLPASTTMTVCLNSTALATAAARNEASMSLYPNPASRLSVVEATWLLPAGTRTVLASVFNLLGQRVAQAAVPVQGNQAVGPLPTAGLPAGMYVVRIQAGPAVVNQKLELF